MCTKSTKQEMLTKLSTAPASDVEALKNVLLDIFNNLIPEDPPPQSTQEEGNGSG